MKQEKLKNGALPFAAEPFGLRELYLVAYFEVESAKLKTLTPYIVKSIQSEFQRGEYNNQDVGRLYKDEQTARAEMKKLSDSYVILRVPAEAIALITKANEVKINSGIIPQVIALKTLNQTYILQDNEFQLISGEMVSNDFLGLKGRNPANWPALTAKIDEVSPADSHPNRFYIKSSH